MQKKIWFKRKLYGFGWHPASLEGWIIVSIYLIILALNAYRLDSGNVTAPQIMMSIFPSTIILSAVLILICYQTGEKPLWQWGTRKEDSPKPVVRKSIKSRKVLKKKSAKK